MKYLLIILIILAIILFLNCDLLDFFKFSEPIEEKELYGVYRANFEDISDYIELRPDTTYLHYTKFPDGRERIDSGFWRFRSDGYSIIPDTSRYYHAKGIWGYRGDCSDNELTFYDFIQTSYTIKGYEMVPEFPGDNVKHVWCTCLYKKGGVIKIKLDPSFGIYYIKKQIKTPAVSTE